MGVDCAVWAAPDPARKIVVQPFIGSLSRILESEYEHTCALCVRRVTRPLAIPYNGRTSILLSSKDAIKILLRSAGYGEGGTGATVASL